jgi:hypothetical protein
MRSVSSRLLRSTLITTTDRESDKVFIGCG